MFVNFPMQRSACLQRDRHRGHVQSIMVEWARRTTLQTTALSVRGDYFIFSAVKTTQRRTGKFANPIGALNETIKLNVEQLLDDANFIKAINENLTADASPSH